uniref:SH2 domain-containing adapter protein B isoform X3 n=1 Tax=Tursiops truncatus TaxID=9739 RepID=A0A6J3RHV5_TURTR|nr:SH2 domain-containing adapter protein B isoform X3 [Tursiops truncatus]
MAKWLNKYFSLGNSKTKSPPQPPRPDYREQRRRGERPSQTPQAVPQAPSATSASCGTAAASCFSASSGSLPDDSGSTSDLIRAYRAQKERDFEDPYNGPGSSLRKLRAMCRLDYCGGGEPGGGQRAFSASSATGAAGCCCAASGAGAAASSSSSSGSPHLYRSSSERRPATPAEVRYISPKHRLIKVESAAGGAAEPSVGSCSGGRTWSPTACGGKKLLNRCGASAAEESGAGKKDKVTIADDYSDPFDAKNDLKSKAGKGESAGYMEPYEAQRIMTGFAWEAQLSSKAVMQNFRGRKASGPSTKASNYTTPLTNPRAQAWTPTQRARSAPNCGRASCPRMMTGPLMNTTSHGNGTGSPSQLWQGCPQTHPPSAAREVSKAQSEEWRSFIQPIVGSSLSSLEGRPGPHLSTRSQCSPLPTVTRPGLCKLGGSAQFNGSEKRQSSPSPSRDRRRQLRAPGGGFKPIKHGSPEFCGILAERVDPAVPLEKQIWYHGAISRGDAENLLRLCKECSYLVRNSQTSRHDYSLSLKVEEADRPAENGVEAEDSQPSVSPPAPKHSLHRPEGHRCRT